MYLYGFLTKLQVEACCPLLMGEVVEEGAAHVSSVLSQGVLGQADCKSTCSVCDGCKGCHHESGRYDASRHTMGEKRVAGRHVGGYKGKLRWRVSWMVRGYSHLSRQDLWEVNGAVKEMEDGTNGRTAGRQRSSGRA